MRTPLKAGLPLTIIEGGADWQYMYILATTANGSSTSATQFIKINRDGEYKSINKTYGQTMSTPYEDDYIKVTYGSPTYYWKCTLKQDGKVNDTDQVAGYNFTWGYAAIKVTILQFY